MFGLDILELQIGLPEFLASLKKENQEMLLDPSIDL
jgi:hypothetical protein